MIPNSINMNQAYDIGVFQKKNKLGCFKRLIGHRCHLGSNRHGWGPLLPGCSILSAQHQYMGSFPQFFAWKIFFLSEPPLWRRGSGLTPSFHEKSIFWLISAKNSIFRQFLGSNAHIFMKNLLIFEQHLVCNQQIHLWEKFRFEVASVAITMRQIMITLLYCTIIYLS